MKKYFVTVNGNRYEVEIEESNGVAQGVAPIAAQAAAPAMAPVAAPVPVAAPAAPAPVAVGDGEKIECPMPGTILKVDAVLGASFKKGDVLFILEAMKMENEIRAPRDCQVIQVVATKGSIVNTGDVLGVIK